MEFVKPNLKFWCNYFFLFTTYRDKQFPEKDVACNWYQSVAKLGDSVKTVPMCRSSFRNCLLNTQQLVELGRGLMFDVILS